MSFHDKQCSESSGKQESPPTGSVPAVTGPQLTVAPICLAQGNGSREAGEGANAPGPNWEVLLAQTESFAEVEILYGYYWRDGFGGVLPDGYDASSIAAEALVELFTEQKENGLILESHLLKADLKKRARRIINRLHHRMENRIMRSTPDLAPFLTHDGETISVVETVLAPDPSPLEILLEKEDAAHFEQFKAQIRAVLAQDRLLLRLFACFCAEICKPKDQARKLKLPVRHIQDLRRRLRRKLAAHRYVPSSGKGKIWANYFGL